MKLEDVKVDFQVTGWCSEDPGKSRLGRFGALAIDCLEGCPRNLRYVMDSLYSLKENRTIFLLNYFQPKYERVVREGLEKAKSDFGVVDNHKDTFVGLSKNGKTWLYIVRGYEIPTNKGHVILGGIPDKFEFDEQNYYRGGGPDLGDTLKWAKEKEAIVIASHPLTDYHSWRRPHESLMLWAVGDPSGMHLGIQEDVLREHLKDFDALESISLSISRKQMLRIRKFGGQIPLVANTDMGIETAFTSYNIFDSLDFSNPSLLRRSIREGLRNGKYEMGGTEEPGALKEKVKHISINLLQSRRHF